MIDVYRVGADGGTPMPVAADRYTTEYFASPAPARRCRRDHRARERRIAVVAQGAQSSRRERDLARQDCGPAGRPRIQPVTKGGAKDAWPMWSADGKTLYFMSDRSGAQNIWSTRRHARAEARESGHHLPRRPRAVADDLEGRQDDRLRARLRHLDRRHRDRPGARSRHHAARRAGGAAVEHRTFTDQIQELALSPDGKKIAFTVHGEIFSASAKDGGDAVRVTTTAGEEAELAWAPDSRRLVYMSDRDGTNHLFVYDFGTGTRDAADVRDAGATTCRASRRTGSGSRSSATRASCA